MNNEQILVLQNISTLGMLNFKNLLKRAIRYGVSPDTNKMGAGFHAGVRTALKMVSTDPTLLIQYQQNQQ
jgi:hypothetical protein